MGIGKKLYSGAADVGTVMSTISAYGGTLLGGAGVIFGVFMATRKDTSSQQAHGVVESEAGKTTDVKNNQMFSYNIKVSGIKDSAGKELQAQTVILSSDRQLGIGEEVVVYYDPARPWAKLELKRVPYFAIGATITGISLLIIGAVWLNYYFVRRSKAYAAYRGVTGTVSAIKNM